MMKAIYGDDGWVYRYELKRFLWFRWWSPVCCKLFRPTMALR